MYENIKRVGRIMDITGPRLMFTRKYPNGREGTFQAVAGTEVWINDRLKTDKDTHATLNFYIGGQAGIAPDTEIIIVGLREIHEVGNQFLITARKVWAKIDKQNSQLQIKTSGGVLGISDDYDPEYYRDELDILRKKRR